MSPFIHKLSVYGIVGLALAGVILSIAAPGWWLALLFAALAVLLGLNQRPALPAPNSVTKMLPRKRSLPETYREIEWKGIIFRSQSEVKIAKTLDHRGIFFIPPTRVRLSTGKDGRQSRELDFVICHEGKWGVLEVDGPFHDRRLDAERDRWLRGHGIGIVQRFEAARCYQTPQAVIDEFLHVLEMESR